MERTPTLYRVNNQLRKRSWPSTTEWLWLYRTAAQKEEYKPKKRKASPLLELPLELRIMIYKYTVSDQEYNITEFHHGYRLPSLFRVHSQITREVCQLCPITTVVDIPIPSHRSRWTPYSLFSLYNAVLAAVKILLALSKAEKLRAVKGRRQLAIKARVRCLGCNRGCKGLDLEEPCIDCAWFAQNFWNPKFAQVCQLC